MMHQCQMRVGFESTRANPTRIAKAHELRGAMRLSLRPFFGLAIGGWLFEHVGSHAVYGIFCGLVLVVTLVYAMFGGAEASSYGTPGPLGDGKDATMVGYLEGYSFDESDSDYGPTICVRNSCRCPCQRGRASDVEGMRSAVQVGRDQAVRVLPRVWP